MITTVLRHSLFAGALIVTGAAHAADVSHWSTDNHSRMRLIAGERDATRGVLRAGVQLQLDSGWKTYWRYPGDAGVPPRFNFDGSQNVKSASVQWPAPQLMTEESGNTIGYEGGVIFPLRIVPQDPGKPVVLRLKLDYAACDKLCIPVVGQAELALDGDHSSQDAALRRAEARVPKRVAIGAGGPLSIRAMRREAKGVLVDVAAAKGGPLTLFAEGPTPEWALPVPMPVEGAPAGLRRFAFDLDGLPPGAKAKGAMLTLTLVARDAAIEAKGRLE